MKEHLFKSITIIDQMHNEKVTSYVFMLFRLMFFIVAFIYLKNVDFIGVHAVYEGY